MYKKNNILISVLSLFLIFNANAQYKDIKSAEVYIKQNNYQEAINYLTAYIELNPTDAHAYLKRAMAHDVLGHISESESDMQYATYLNPFAYMYISNAARSKGYEKKVYDYDLKSSESNFKKSPVNNRYYELYLADCFSLHTQDSLIERAIYFLSQNNIDSTESILEYIRPENNIEGIYYDLKGLVALKKNDLEIAIDYFSKAIDKMPEFPLAYHNRAIAYKLQGDYGMAMSDIKTAIRLNENISVFFFTLAKLSERLENPKEAITYYKEAIDNNPDYIEAKTNLSILQKTLGNYDEAIVELMEVSRMMNNNAYQHYINGGINLTYGEYEKAISEFNLYLESNKEDCDAIFNRGLAKILSGNKMEGCDDIYQSTVLKKDQKRLEILQAFCPSY